MNVLVAAGGTGGHITPGLSIANKLREKGNNIIFVGTKNGMEVDLVPKAGFELRCKRFNKWNTSQNTSRN